MILEIFCYSLSFVFIVTGILLCTLAKGKNSDNQIDFGMGLCKWTLVCLFGLFFIFFISPSFTQSGEASRFYQHSISSLERDGDIHGSFFLGSGSINSRQVYYFYAQNEKGYYLMSSDDLHLDCGYSNILYLIEDDSQTPQIICEKKCTTTGKDWSMLNWFGKNTECEEQYNRLIIPKNTIIKEFKA